MITEHDFMNELMNHQYISQHFTFRRRCKCIQRAIKYIPAENSVNETAKLYIKHNKSEDMQAEIIAI